MGDGGVEGVGTTQRKLQLVKRSRNNLTASSAAAD